MVGLTITNPCDFPVVVISEAPYWEYRTPDGSTLGPSDALDEGLDVTRSPSETKRDSMDITAVPARGSAITSTKFRSTRDVTATAFQIDASATSAAGTDHGDVLALPPACDSPRAESKPVIVAQAYGEQSSSWIKIAGPVEAVDAFVEAAEQVDVGNHEVTREIDLAASLRVRMDTGGTIGVFEPLVAAAAAHSLEPVQVAWCRYRNVWDLQAVGPDSEIPQFELPGDGTTLRDVLVTVAVVVGILLVLMLIFRNQLLDLRRRVKRDRNLPPPPGRPPSTLTRPGGAG